MRIFFGRIKPTTDNNQIKGTYYETLSPMKLGELETGDYAFIISGKDVHLWRATERLDIDGRVRVNFDVILDKLPMTSQQLVAFKYFKLYSSLMVLTVRRTPKAFHRIYLADGALTEAMLGDMATYMNKDNFRNIRVLKSAAEITAGSKDIQLYFDSSGELYFVDATFFDPDLIPNFVNNLPRIGNGRKMKDNTLQQIKEGSNGSVTYSYEQLPIMRMYDALFNDYGAPDEVEPLPENGTDHVEATPASMEMMSRNQIYYGPPGTGKTYLVRKSFCLDEGEAVKGGDNRIKLDENRNFWHLAPGKGGYLWEKLKAGNVLGYEWVDKSWGDLVELTHKDIEEEGWGSYQLISYLRHVKVGDYICVISGRKLLGIAEVTASYSYQTAIQNEFSFQTLPVRWLKQFEQPLSLNSTQTKTFVRLNDGTRWGTLLTLLRENGFYFHDSELTEHQLVKRRNFSFISFHQSFSYEDFIEGIKPALYDTDGDEEAAAIEYTIEQGIFYQACEEAARLAGYSTLQACLGDDKVNRQKMFSKEGLLEYYLIIDEINRGNVAAAFGELITLIEDDKRLGASSEIIITLPYSKSLFGVPANLRIIGTMNTADRSVEALDTALRRRFTFEELYPNPMELRPVIEGLDVDLRRLLTAINGRLEKLVGRDHTIGHAFFIKVETVKDLRRVMANQIIPLLQEYFYSDYAKIGLVIGMPFLEVKAAQTVFKKVDYFDSNGLADGVIYGLKKFDNWEDEEFLQAIRGIYEV